MRVVNTAGWDTDCNSGNLGCLLGIRGGLSVFEGEHDWRGPVADRMYLPSANGGAVITDAVIESQRIVISGRALAGEPPVTIKEGSRFHFEFPGSVQGFRALESTTRLENVSGHSRLGQRCLALDFTTQGSAVTPTFIQPQELSMPGYGLLASPTLYPGQTIHAGFTASQGATARLFIQVYNHEDKVDTVYAPTLNLQAGEYTKTTWIVPETGSQPIAAVGIECQAEFGDLYLDYLTWQGSPDVVLTRPFAVKHRNESPQVWRRAWVNAVDLWQPWWPETYRLVQNKGRGLIIQGTRDWQDYTVEAEITPWLMNAGGIAARVQGLKRFYALLLVEGGKICLQKALDGDSVLAEKTFPWQLYQSYALKLQVLSSHIRAWVNGELLFEHVDEVRPLTDGGVAFVLDQGHLCSQAMVVRPVN
jgi:hypothetical protein